MIKKIFTITLTLFLTVSWAMAREIGGVEIPETLTIGKYNLVLNGGGVRSKFFIKAYSAGLYLRKKEKDSKEIINANKPMAIRMHITTGMVSRKRMEDALWDGFKKATNGNIDPIKNEINQFFSVFDDIKKFDKLDLIYLPGKGIIVHKNGNPIEITIEGLNFKKILFSIWLGDDPVCKKLKKGMLGL